MTASAQVSPFVALENDAFDALTPIVRSDVVIHDLDDHAVAWSPISSHPLALGPLSATVLRLLDGDVSAGELVGDLSDVFDADEAAARDLLRRELAAFAAAGALEGFMPSAQSDRGSDVFPAPPNP